VVEGVVVDPPTPAEEPVKAAPPAVAESTLKGDIIAGLSVACVAIPQSCGYAMLAGTGVKCAIMVGPLTRCPPDSGP
jgi:MFS superfamily sulfate permease-like transporter